MSAHLPRRELERLAKICGRLGSVHDGERAAAALKADQLVRGLGLTWREVLAPRSNLLTAPEAQSLPAKIELLRRHLPMLTEWERGFVVSLARFRRFSPKQVAVIDRLTANIERRAA
jgi:hypothetical protein